MKTDKELVKKTGSGLFEMKFVKKAKSFGDFLKSVDSLTKPHTLPNKPAKDNVTMKNTKGHNLSKI